MVSTMIGVALTATLAAAQLPADFSGVWRPVDALSSAIPPPPPPAAGPGGPPPPPPPPKTISTTIMQSASELTVRRHMEGADGPIVQAFTYRLDGGESVNQFGPIVFRTTAAWDGAALVLSSTLSTEGQPLGVAREVYRLENGNLVVETNRRTPAGTFTSTGVNARDR